MGKQVMSMLSQKIFRSCPEACLGAHCCRLVRALRAPFNPYRPELHYMRGPGPKWHAKYGQAATALEAARIGRSRS
jgi:hypothetical protein